MAVTEVQRAARDLTDGAHVIVDTGQFATPQERRVTGTTLLTTWRVPFGDDWTTRRLRLESQHPNSKPLVVDVLDREVHAYTHEDGERVEYRGEVLTLTEDNSLDRAPPLDEQIQRVLEDEGELPASEIKLLTESTSNVYNVLSRLKSANVVTARKDPDDGRRQLYRLAGDPTRGDEADQRNDDEQLTVDGISLPDDLTTGDVRDAADGCKTVVGVARQLGVDTGKARACLFDLGLYDQVTEGRPERESSTEADD